MTRPRPPAAEPPRAVAIRARYLFAVALVAGVSLGVHLLIRHGNAVRLADARVLNLAGRQRMLSQRIALLTVGPGADEGGRDRAEQALALFERTHRGLVTGDVELGLPPVGDAEPARAMEEVHVAFGPYVEAARAALQGLGGPPEARRAEARLAAAADVFLPLMDRAVGTFERAARNRTERLDALIGWLLVLTLGVLGLEVVFVFEPMRRLVLAQMGDLTRQREAAQDAMRTKSRFVAVMSHEIRTPLNGVLGAIELLGRTRLDRLQASYHGILRSGAEALLSLVNAVLDLSRLDAASLELEARRLDLHALAADAVRRFSLASRPKGVDLVLDIGPDAPRWVIGDAARLRQVIDNLLGNAIKFTAEGWVRLAVARRGEQVLLTVEDTGEGIPEAALHHVFEPFRQADASTSAQHGGTGLGLSIVRGIVEAMGGEVHVESAVGRGSTFEVELPLGAPDEAPLRAGALDVGRVLVVGGHPRARAALVEQLRAWGAEVEAVTTAEAASGIAGQAFFDLAILDALPEPEHRALAPALRSRGARVLRIVDPLGAVGGAEEGEEACLARPFTPAQLEALLAGRSSAPSEPAPPWPGTPRPGEGLRVLVVDDDAINRVVAEALLEAAGARVETRASGAEAVDACAEGVFDLVLMDMRMPEMDGLEATRRIRASAAGRRRHLPIVALTANTAPEDHEACRAAGMEGLVAKPIVPSQLEALLERVRGEVGQGARSS